ncbi:putative bifunctional diguanylate cyclase/phosphodiesterase [Rubrivivax albus]|uniref:GGDEF and EAL domain-containing protein n=1 Tax=Rubrivivax albus TaxID=2499835 RepID=A0A3S2VUQ6_9BURK|nr:GGDEF and EAL domain-containing protein [Rubrivivax albus]RVT49280.1 GGDEF and EAL domain-containing protein [Rubrivivax albus]
MTPPPAPPATTPPKRRTPAARQRVAGLWAAALLALLPPAVLGGLGWRLLDQELDASAAALAADLARLRSEVPAADWPALARQRLAGDDVAGRLASVADTDGALVATSTASPDWPTRSAAAALHGGGALVLTRSMRGPLALGALLWLSAAGALLLWRRAPPADRTASGAATRADAAVPALRTLIESFHDGILLYGDDGLVRDCNSAASRLLGLPAEQILGQPLARWVDLAHGATTVGKVESQAHRGSPTRPFPCELAIARVPHPGHDLWSATLRDLTERNLAERQLQQLANFDPLTGLPNRALFRDRLRLAIARAGRSGQPMALMFLDLDRFKNVNDSLGHDAGDRLLQQVAARLGAALRGSDTVGRSDLEQSFTVARLGGDEFTIVAESLRSADDALRIAERIQQALQQPVLVGKHEIVVSTSIGITVYPDDPSPPDDLLRHADQAMYRAKELGRDQVQFYSVELNEQAQRRLQLEGELRHALERGEFELAWQPKADIQSGHISGAEVLLRWQRAGQSVATPDVFIRVLEETGLIMPVGRWVLEQAARQIVAWRRAGLPWLRVAVNLSARQLRQGDLVRTVSEVLETSGLPSAQLELELTESMLMGGEQHQRLLHRLSALGVQLAIDDFGTGWSSLSYLKRFNVDTLKIDRSFVRDTPHDPEDNAIATAVIALARSLKLRVVAEGVETPEQRRFLLDNGCDEFQGWLLSRPLSARAFEAWWRQQLLLASGAEVEHATLP